VEAAVAQTFEIVLEDFAFPKTLSKSRANFRLVFDVRYITRTGAFATEHVVMPGLDTYWECDPEKKDQPNYVRGADEGSLTRIDMSRIDEWDRLILLLHAESIHAIQVKAFDVNREDVWNRLREAIAQIVESVFAATKRLADKAPPPAALGADAFGSAADDLLSHLLTRLGNADKILFRGAVRGGTGVKEVTGRGTGGDYRARIAINLVPAPRLRPAARGSAVFGPAAGARRRRSSR
jgi:hypothetical protein